jgi:hypothetical protein
VDFEMLPLPEEVKQQMREQMDQHHMAIDSFRHDVQRLFEEIDQEHLLTLRHLFNHFAQQTGAVYPAYLEGVAAATLHHRFGVCASCGEDHTAELLKQDGADSQPQPPGEGQPAGDQLELPFPADNSVSASDEAEYLLLCEQFNVTPSEGSKPGVTCRGCGQDYVSLGDRMIKPPGEENCPGCVHKAKWG